MTHILIRSRTSPPRARAFATTSRGVGRDRLACPPISEPVFSFPQAKAPAPTNAAALGLVAAIAALMAIILT